MNIRNNIARIGATALIGCGLVATSVPATFAVEGAPQVVHTYADSAQFIAPDVWIEGQGLNIGGEGFKTADGTSGSVLALKLNKGAVKINGQDYLEIHADAAGNFSVTIPWQEELHGSVSVDIYLLSGSLKDGDVPRGGKAATVTIKVAEQPAPAPSEDPTPVPSQDPTPAPSEDPTPAPSEDSPRLRPRIRPLRLPSLLTRPPHPQLRTLRKPSLPRIRSLPKSRSLMNRSLTRTQLRLPSLPRATVSRTAPMLRRQAKHRSARVTRTSVRSSMLMVTASVASSPLTTRTPRSLTAFR